MLDFHQISMAVVRWTGGIFLLSILSGVSMCIYKESNRETIPQWDYGKYSVGKCTRSTEGLRGELCLASEPGKPYKIRCCVAEGSRRRAVEIWRMKFRSLLETSFHQGVYKWFRSTPDLPIRS